MHLASDRSFRFRKLEFVFSAAFAARTAAWFYGVLFAVAGAIASPASALESLPEKVVVLTFDDSVKSQATFVAPLLKELGFSATFFITEGFDFKTNKLDYMTWEEIRQLHDLGFEIGNHTRDHMGVSKASLAQLPEQLEAINAQCRLHGIPQPVSFAYPGNSIHPQALPILTAAGIKFGRRGGSPEYAYAEGKGVAYEPGKDHPLLIPTAGDARPNWALTNFIQALDLGGKGNIVVFQFHGVPDRQHPWVNTPPDLFHEEMLYLKEHSYRVLALRDLERFVDLAIEPADPMSRIEERQRQIAASHSAPAQRTQNAPPWDMALLAKPPEWTALERPKVTGIEAITYPGTPFRGKPTRVFAWLGIPKLPPGTNAPAMVLIHGGGGTAFEEWVHLWVERGYVAIAMDTCGQVPVGNYGRWFRDEQGGPPGWGGWDQIDWPREDQWTYHAVADAILAHSLIRSLPEVDPERTGVTGISWGGYLTCIVAGVDQRFKLAVPVYGCGFYRETTFEGALKKLTPEQADRWLAWWDPSVYLPEAKVPMLWVTGSNDFAYPLGALQHSYRLAQGPHSLCVRLRMPHGHGGPGENPEEIRVFADNLFNGTAGLPKITGSGRESSEAWATYLSNVPVAKAELNYTKDNGRWQDRQWESIPAAQDNGRIHARLPEGTRAYYFNLIDDRGCLVSSEHEIIHPPGATQKHDSIR